MNKLCKYTSKILKPLFACFALMKHVWRLWSLTQLFFLWVCDMSLLTLYGSLRWTGHLGQRAGAPASLSLFFSLSSVKAYLFVSPFRNQWVGGLYRAQPVWLSNSCSLLTRGPELTLYDKSLFLPQTKVRPWKSCSFFLNRKSLFYQDCKLYMLMKLKTLFRSHQQFTYQR